jgi:hypothetical protein
MFGRPGQDMNHAENSREASLHCDRQAQPAIAAMESVAVDEDDLSALGGG